MRTAGHLYAARASIQTGLMTVAVEPFVIFALAVAVGATVLSLFLPLVMLLNALS